ncbi:MAG: signal recognition particle protein [Acidobacteria bacterium]|nr:MAG: signal recognition particle protein [Acidobacteriota bacterium]REK11621.1 MAG: signal recognition particle protein [Acidobacteriota bacterium]
MFDGLQGKLEGVFSRLRGQGKVSEDDLRRAMREIRLALLDADVNVQVVRDFVASVQQKALGEEVLRSLTPDQQVLKIVRDELNQLLGEPGQELQLKGRPAVVMLCGLQGSGKTTTIGKLAKRLRDKQHKNPVLVAGDLQRAAAIEQLRQVGAAIDVPVITPREGEDVVAFAPRALREAREGGRDVVLFDTAGRLHVDDSLMDELRSLVQVVSPQELLFVCDAMTGQDAVRSAAHFAGALPVSGVILTKLDGDSRGGAALSIRAVAEVPIRFVGVGEKVEDLELFQPERTTSRILGMGDMLSLIEKAEQAIDKDQAERMAQRIARRQFTLEDLRDQLRQIRKMGPLGQLMEMLPKTGPFKGLAGAGAQVDETRLVAIEALINSMTPREREKPGLLNASRKRRIAAGSGRTVQELNQLLKQYKQMQKMMKRMKGGFLRGALG